MGPQMIVTQPASTCLSVGITRFSEMLIMECIFKELQNNAYTKVFLWFGSLSPAHIRKMIENFREKEIIQCEEMREPTAYQKHWVLER